jgi:hypothetical protein
MTGNMIKSEMVVTMIVLPLNRSGLGTGAISLIKRNENPTAVASALKKKG